MFNILEKIYFHYLAKLAAEEIKRDYQEFVDACDISESIEYFAENYVECHLAATYAERLTDKVKALL